MYYKTALGWTGVGNTTDTTLVHKKVESGTSYTYTVKCISGDGNYAASDYDKIGKSITYIAAPVITKIEKVEDGFRISWNKITGAKKYRLFVKESAGWKRLIDTASTAFTHTGLVKGKRYTYTVCCIESDGKSYTSGYNEEGWTCTFGATSVILGDTDLDGKVTIVDATCIQRHLVGLSTNSFDEKAADADEDGKVTILDATAIQRHLASLPTNQNIGKPMG